MDRCFGQLSTDAYGVLANELKIGHFQIPNAPAADADGILDGTALPATASSVTTFLAQPPVPMNLTMVCSATQTGKATAYGTNINGDLISEEFTLNSATPVVGAKAFKTVTEIVLPQKAGSETIDVGWGVKFGLPYMLSTSALVLLKLFNGSSDSGTVTADADELEKNVFALNGTADGAKDIDLYIIV